MNYILNSLLEFAFNGMNNVLDTAVNIVSQSPNEFNSQINSTMNSINAILIVIGGSIAVIFFLMDLSEKASTFDRITFQMFVGSFIKLIFCTVIMQHSFVVMNGIFDISSYINSMVGEVAINESTIDLEGAKETISNAGFLERFMLFGILMTMSVFSFIAQIIVICIAYGRIVELYLMSALAPIPIAFMSSSEHQSVGKNYLHHYAGVCLQGVVIIVIISIYSALSTSMVMQPGDTFSSIFGSLAVNIGYCFLLAGVLVKSGTWSQKLVRAI